MGFGSVRVLHSFPPPAPLLDSASGSGFSIILQALPFDPQKENRTAGIRPSPALDTAAGLFGPGSPALVTAFAPRPASIPTRGAFFSVGAEIAPPLYRETAAEILDYLERMWYIEKNMKTHRKHTANTQKPHKGG